MEEQTLQLGDLRGVLRRRGRTMVIIAGASLLLAIFLAAVWPNSYVAFTTLLIEPQTISKRLVDPGVEQGEMTNRLHLMTMQILSRSRLSRVIDELGLYSDLADKMTREEVIERMRSRIWVAPVLPELATAEPSRRNQPLEINTFQLFFRHGDAAMAAAVANRLSNDFIDEHIRERVQVSGDTAEFIENELGRLAGRLREVEGQIAQVKAENSGSLPENRINNETLLTRLLDALREAKRGLAEAQSDEAFYRQQAVVVRSSEQNERGNVVGKAVSPALRMQELEMTLGEFRARGYTDKHPDVVVAQTELEELRARANSDDPENSAMSTAEQQTRGLAERAEMRAKTEEQEVERLQGEVDNVQERLARAPRVAEQLDVLMREYASLSESFQDYSNKRVEATVAANMERRQKGEQFRVLEAAVTPPEPDSPNRPLIIGLGLLLGLALAGTTALVQEATDSSYHGARTLQERLRIPVLASIPGILLDSDRLARRHQRVRDLTVATAVSGAVLVASIAGYVYVNRPGWIGLGDTPPPAAAPAAPAAPGAAPAAPAAPGAPAAAPAPAPAGG